MGVKVSKQRKFSVPIKFQRGDLFGESISVFGEDAHEVLKRRAVEKDSKVMLKMNAIFELLDNFDISKPRLIQLSEDFSTAIKNGLSRTESSDLKMLPTYVLSIPDGKEVGKYMALDLGGTNFRILSLTLTGDPSNFEIISNAYSISGSLMTGKGRDLFAFIVSKIKEFMKENAISMKEKIQLGFTFSFPCNQVSLDEGYLVCWTKGFKCSGVVGQDIVKLLQQSIDKEHLNIQVVALINDTVGTLLACAFANARCHIGMIIGTGTNACYLESIDKIKTLKGKVFKKEKMVVNVEWGAYGESDPNYNLNLFKTKYDIEIDKTSVNPGKQIFEKMVSGMYLGEIARLIIIDLIERRLLLVGCLEHVLSYSENRQPIYTKNAFYSKYISEIEMDRGKHFKKTKRILSLLGFQNPSKDDCTIVHFICRLVSQRAAKLVAASLVALIKKTGLKDLTIGVDGSLYRFHPKFMQNVECYCNQLLSPDIKYTVALANDGSGMGAALAAAAAAAKTS